MARHNGIVWTKVEARLEANASKLWSPQQMEQSSGEPDAIGQDKKSGEYLFVDRAAESPSGRRSVYYDREGLESRKEHRPANSAVDMATEMGMELLAEEQYHALQELEEFDLKR